MRERLASVQNGSYLQRAGTGRGAYWTLHPGCHRRLAKSGHHERNRRIDWEVVKTRVLSIPMERGKRGEKGLGNQDIRRITAYDRNRVFRLMTEHREESPTIQAPGNGRACAL